MAAGAIRALSAVPPLPVLGLRRCSRFARATASGCSSTRLLRPSHLPTLARLRSRAAFSLDTSRAFSSSAGDLAHGLLHQIIRLCQVLPGGGQDRDATRYQCQYAELLRDEVAGEAAGALDNHSAHAVALDVVQQGGEAGALLNRIGTTHGRVVILRNDGNAARPA